MQFYDEETTYLAIPGPVPIHPSVYREMSKPIYGHRTPEFRKIVAECIELLKPLFGLRKGLVIILTGSGTSAMDAAVRSFVEPKDKVISFVNGKFSERLAEIAESCGANVVRVDVEWGKAIKPELVEKYLDKHSDAKFITLTHNETSTGVLNPLHKIAKIAQKYSVTVIADGITAVGGTFVKQEEWGVDIEISGSQKCLGIPPGLGFVGLTEKALQMLENKKTHAYYTNLRIYLETWLKKKDLPFTGAVSLIYALHRSLKIIHAEGLENRFRRHAIMAEALREGIKALGLEIFAEPGYESPTVTAVRYPEGIKDDEFRSLMLKYGILVAGGQAHLKGKIFRIATMNLIGPREILMILSVMEFVLRKLDFKPKESGILAAVEVFRRYGI